MVDEFYCALHHHPNGQRISVCYRRSNSNHRYEANVHILAGYFLPWVFDKMPRPRQLLKLFVHKGAQQVARSGIIPGGCSGFSVPPNGPINARALSLVPGYHSNPRWAIVVIHRSRCLRLYSMYFV